jgi:hypothetical protein
MPGPVEPPCGLALLQTSKQPACAAISLITSHGNDSIKAQGYQQVDNPDYTHMGLHIPLGDLTRSAVLRLNSCTSRRRL